MQKDNSCANNCNPSKQDAKKKEACTSIEEEDGNEMFLNGKNPFFDVVLTDSNTKHYYHLYLPTSIVSLLPGVSVPVVLRYGSKKWDAVYKGDAGRPSFRPGWKEFVEENHLKNRDACVFELMENTSKKLTFKVIILRNQDLPAQLNHITDNPVIQID